MTPTRLPWTVTEADFPEVLAWVVPVLLDTYPALSENGVAHWLRSMAGDRSAYLVRTVNGVGLFHATHDAFDPRPFVEEKFVRFKVPQNDEAMALYCAAGRWALGIKARGFRFNMDAVGAPMVQWVVPAVERALQEKARKASVYQVNFEG